MPSLFVGRSAAGWCFLCMGFCSIAGLPGGGNFATGWFLSLGGCCAVVCCTRAVVCMVGARWLHRARWLRF